MRMKETAIWVAVTVLCGLLTFCSLSHVQRGMNAYADNVTIHGINIADNTLPVGKIQAGGTKNSTTFLRGDGYWGVAPIGATGPQGPPGTDWDNTTTLNINNFPADLRPIKVVDNVLAVICKSDNVYVEGAVVYDKLTYKLYRCASDNNWKTFIDNTDIQGTIGDSLISAMNAAKLAGQITQTQIADNSISTPKLIAGVINSSALLSGKIITNSFIADNTITNSLIADNAIIRGSMIADNIITNNMLVGSISGAKMAADNIITMSAQIGTAVVGKLNLASGAATNTALTTGNNINITDNCDSGVVHYNAMDTVITFDGSLQVIFARIDAPTSNGTRGIYLCDNNCTSNCTSKVGSVNTDQVWGMASLGTVTGQKCLALYACYQTEPLTHTLYNLMFYVQEMRR